jgi:glycosyltransferase involved in cell wall biosynthesis
MRLVVVGHTYLVAFNQQKWTAFVEAVPDAEVLLVAPSRWTDANFGVVPPDRPTHPRVSLATAPIFGGTNGILTAYLDPRLIGRLKAFRPDIILVEQEPKSLSCLQFGLLARLLRLQPRLAIFTWNNLPHHRRPFPFSSIERLTLQQARLVLAGNHAAAEIIRHAGYRRALEVMPQVGIDADEFQPGRSQDLRDQLGLTDVVVGFAGRLVERKGVLTLVEALAVLGDLRWQLLLVGSGDRLPAMRQILSEKGLGDRLVMAGTVPQEAMAPYLNCMDIMVLPSWSTPTWIEQFGHVLVEAMACGVAVIGSDSGEIPYVIGDAGAVVPEQDAQALRAELAASIGTPGRRRDLGARGRQRVLDRYTHQAVALQLQRCFEGMLSA